MSNTNREKLRDLLVRCSVRLGDFTLASGAKSDYYIDARLTTMSAEGQRLVGLVQRTGAACFAPAFDVDPDYAAALHEVATAPSSVEVQAWQASVTPTALGVRHPLAVALTRAALAALVGA